MPKQFIPNPQDKSDVFSEKVFEYLGSKGYDVCILSGIVNRYGNFDDDLSINKLPIAIFKNCDKSQSNIDVYIVLVR